MSSKSLGLDKIYIYMCVVTYTTADFIESYTLSLSLSISALGKNNNYSISFSNLPLTSNNINKLIPIIISHIGMFNVDGGT